MKLAAALFALLLFASCTGVTVDRAAGDKPAVLEHSPEGIWRGNDGAICTIVRVPNLPANYKCTTDGGDARETFWLTLRQLKDRTVATVVDEHGDVPEDSGFFFRIAISEESICLFAPRQERFHEAVLGGKIAGKHQPASKELGAFSGPWTRLKKFTAAEVDAMSLPQKGSVLECFEPDPCAVVVRERKPR